MNFLEAIKAMKEGKKVTRPYMKDNSWYIKMGGEWIGTTSKAEPVTNSITNIEATDWEVAEDKKEQMPIIIEKASERKHCPYCDTGKIHKHIVTVDKGIVNYIRSLGKFKDLPLDITKTKKDIYECSHCKEPLSEEVMGKKCPKCGKWTYHSTCKKEVTKTLSDKIKRMVWYNKNTSIDTPALEVEDVKETMDDIKAEIEEVYSNYPKLGFAINAADINERINNKLGGKLI